MNCSIALLLGAGFSAPFGVPTMRPFLDAFRTMATQKHCDLTHTLERHVDGLADDSDVEGLLSSLGRAERLSDGAPPGDELPTNFRKWQQESRFLKSHLISYIIEQCERFDQTLVNQVLSPALRELNDRKWLDTIHIFTTNYDRVIENSCDMSDVEYSDGFGDVVREPVAPWTREFDRKVRIYKLHGSVSYYVDRSTVSGQPHFLRLDRGYPLPGPDFRLSRGGHDLEPIMVLPTLEKDTLGEPYSYLNHLFTETISDTLLVLAVGTSLRDNHIVSAINYNAKNLIVLLVDSDPAAVVHRIPDVRSVKLRTDARRFFESSIVGLCDVIELCLDKERDDVYSSLEMFCTNEAMRLSKSVSLNSTLQDALNCLSSAGCSGAIMKALYQLRGRDEDRIIRAVAAKVDCSFPVDVRKAAAACLGHSANPTVVSVLASVAQDDASSAVRLECCLALKEISTEDSMRKLGEIRATRPHDAVFLSLS